MSVWLWVDPWGWVAEYAVQLIAGVCVLGAMAMLVVRWN